MKSEVLEQHESTWPLPSATVESDSLTYISVDITSPPRQVDNIPKALWRNTLCIVFVAFRRRYNNALMILAVKICSEYESINQTSVFTCDVHLTVCINLFLIFNFWTLWRYWGGFVHRPSIHNFMYPAAILQYKHCIRHKLILILSQLWLLVEIMKMLCVKLPNKTWPLAALYTIILHHQVVTFSTSYTTVIIHYCTICHSDHSL